MAIVVLKLKAVKRQSEERPGKCPHCEGETFQRWGQVRKPVKDALVKSVVTDALFLGLLVFDSFILPHLKQRLPLAIGFVVFGSAIGTWAWSTFGLRNTIGVGYKLITRGAYPYSRNPQYIADSLGAIGYMIFTNSWMVCVVGGLGVLLNVLAPYTEESWLEERYGEEYRQYKRRVPRFVRRRHMKAD